MIHGLVFDFLSKKFYAD